MAAGARRCNYETQKRATIGIENLDWNPMQKNWKVGDRVKYYDKEFCHGLGSVVEITRRFVYFDNGIRMDNHGITTYKENGRWTACSWHVVRIK